MTKLPLVCPWHIPALLIQGMFDQCWRDHGRVAGKGGKKEGRKERSQNLKTL